MEITLQSKINYKSVHERRTNMITEQKLHIQDSITYDSFKQLYQIYGMKLEEQEFAKYFLDIDYRSFYNLQSGLRNTTQILEREYYSYEELDRIDEQILLNSGLKPKDKIGYEELIDLHNTYGDKFSLKMFAEENLGITAHKVDDMNFDKSQRAVVLKKEKVSRKKISDIKNRVVSELNLHIGSKITLEEFNEIYDKYATCELDEKTFALKVLRISNDAFTRFKKGKREYVTVFLDYPINPDKIQELRKYVIINEKLHMNELISNEKFDELYKKYAGILTEELFAEEILDTSLQNVKTSKRRKNNISILGKIEIPNEYIEEFQEKIANENSLKPYQLMSLEEIQKLYARYNCILSERQFATLVLGIPNYNYNQLNTGDTKKSCILVDNKEKDFKAIRECVIRENHLHYDDKIDYYGLHKLHQKYGKTIREKIFASEILDITQDRLDNIRNDKGEKNTHILLLEPLPSIEEINQIKKEVIQKNKFHRRDEINYRKFRKVYNEYGGIMPEDMFAEQILDILKASLDKIRLNKGEKTQILIRTIMSKEEIKALREEILLENALYPEREISLDKFEKLYNNYSHTLSQIDFAKKILEINSSNLGQLKNEEVDTVKVCRNGITEEENIEKYKIKCVKNLYDSGKSATKIQKTTDMPLDEIIDIISQIKSERKEERRREKQKILEKGKNKRKAFKIIEGYNYTPKNVAAVQKYIDECRCEFKEGSFEEQELEFLGECITFNQGGLEDIVLFSRICISFQNYELAYRFISENIYNESVKKIEKEELRKIQKEIENTINKKIYAKTRRNVTDNKEEGR